MYMQSFMKFLFSGLSFILFSVQDLYLKWPRHKVLQLIDCFLWKS